MTCHLKNQVNQMLGQCLAKGSWEPLVFECRDDVSISCPWLPDGFAVGVEHARGLLTESFCGGLGQPRVFEIDGRVYGVHVPAGCGGEKAYIDMTLLLLEGGFEIVSINWPCSMLKCSVSGKEQIERYRLILDCSDDMFFEWDIKNDRLVSFGGVKDVLAESKNGVGLLDDKRWRMRLHPDDSHRLTQTAVDMASGETEHVDTEVRIMGGSGEYSWFRIRALVKPDHQGKPERAGIIVTDISKEKERVRHLKEQAEGDGLTGLYNKAATERHSDAYIRGAAQGSMSALMIIDVDNFKLVNDTYGHLGGDIFLTDIAKVIKARFRDTDIVGRIGGDEFAVLMKDVSSRDNIIQKAEKILADVAGIFAERHDNPLPISCSIGIAIAPEHGQDFATIYQKADSALYSAKTEGKNRYAFYSDDGLGMQSGSYKTAVGKIDFGVAAIPEARAGGRGFAEYIFKTLYACDRSDKAINDTLGLVGTRFGAGAAYICMRDGASGRYACRYFWGRGGRSGQSMYGRWFDSFQEDGIYYCGDINMLKNDERADMATENTKSFVRRTITNNGEIVAFVAFDNYGEDGAWSYRTVDALSFIAEIIGVFLF